MTQPQINYERLAEKIQLWAHELGFSQVGITDVDLSSHEEALLQWLDNNYHGNMDYMARHGLMRARPAELEVGAIRAISVRLDYLPANAKFSQILSTPNHAYISRYALGRDYHKLMRKRMQQLGNKIKDYCYQFNFRPFVDSAPILERPLAEKAGLGWVGKHSLLINKEAGSWFFIGELLVDIPLPLSLDEGSDTSNKADETEPCGNCTACISICPTQAIVEPYVVDARRCISYFTIESPEPIPLELRPLMGNRIYGCDDCQLICPWNRYAKLSLETDFQPRHKLDEVSLIELFSWSEEDFLRNMEGSPIRRIGFESWQRNIAVALGNAPYEQTIVTALEAHITSSELVAEHINWALEQQYPKQMLSDYKQSNQTNKQLIKAIVKSLPRDA